jgi:2-keto-3-deoxy-L-fuconate dehydrogenase
MYTLDITGRTAVITGAGSGIGKSIAMTFAIAGAKVVILDRDTGAGKSVANEINSNGGSAESYHCDMADWGQVQQTMTEIHKANHSIDILVNNAGISHIGTLNTTSSEDFQRLLDINVKGVFHGMKAVVPYMVAANKGVILNMASVAATVALADRFAYSMTKAAVLNMTLTTAKDYLEHNIRCVSVSPGRVHTPFVDDYLAKNYPGNETEMFEKLSKTQPIGRMGKPEEIANLVVFLCSDKAAFITGTDYPVDGGFIKLNT